jgi:NCAIR mutase (PurE)-related protein
MDTTKLKKLLTKIRDREIGVTQAMEEFRTLPFEDLDFAKIDHHRAIRKGLPEVILAEGKSIDQLQQIIQSLEKNSEPLLVTRLTEEVFSQLSGLNEKCVYHRDASILSLNLPEKADGPANVCVISAGTSDSNVVREASLTLRAFNIEPKVIQDVGVAGIHRLFAHLQDIAYADVIIVVAGMDGALASVVSGLVIAPVIAVPTSIGYGASFGGVSALLAMLNSCASGLTVVNIDNGFGAAYAAGLMINKIYP